MIKRTDLILLIFSLVVFNNLQINAQFIPKNTTQEEIKRTENWVNSTYEKMSIDEKIGQLFVVALYTNKGEDFINNVRQIIENEKIGGLILMQDDASKEIDLINEFQKKSKIPLLIGMDTEWGLYQRIPTAYKYPWAITLGAIQNKQTIYEIGKKIAKDAKRMGINWNFAPVVDVNTNPKNPIIGNRSFGSTVDNVTTSALAYSNGIQDENTLATIKHFPGHGDTNTDSHLALPIISHPIERLEKIELAPFKNLINKNIGGVMIAHIFIPALETQKNIPASLSYSIVTQLLKEKMGYKGLIITDALNMKAVADSYPAGAVDALAFKAGNDIMLFSQDVAKGKSEIKKAIENKEISEERLEESVKKILSTKYLLGLLNPKEINPSNIHQDLKTENHRILIQKAYSESITLLKDNKKNIPLNPSKKYYYLALEEAPINLFPELLQIGTNIQSITIEEAQKLPSYSNLIIGIHKDNSTAYAPYQLSNETKIAIETLSKKHNVILNLFGSPYALHDLNTKKTSTILIHYENNHDSILSAIQALFGKKIINGRLPVHINNKLTAGKGIDFYPKNLKK